MDTSDHRMPYYFKGPGAVASGLPALTASKMSWLSASSFSVGTKYTGDFKCLHG